MRAAAAAAVFVLALSTLLAQEPPPEEGQPRTSADVPATPTPGPVLKRAPVPTPKEIGIGGGSLADIARRNRARREKEPKKKSLGVITNESLRKGSAPVATPAPKGVETPAAHRVVGASTPTAGIPEPRDFEGRTESEWRKRSADLKARQAQAEANVKKLDAEVHRLENDFYAWSDGNYRDRVIKPALDQARADLDKAKRDAEDAKTKFDNLEDEARKSGAPPGWLR
jgi:outer membrane murein-binding lipoprotein Lpp